MEKIENIISEKEEEIKTLKPKYYLIKGYLSTFLSLQWLPLFVIFCIYLMLLFLFIDNFDPNGLKTLILKITFFLTEFLAILLGFDFRFSFTILNKKFKIDKYQTALYELNVLKENKKILDKVNNIKNII